MCGFLMLLISVPLTFIRDYSTPIGELAAWNRTRAAVIPVTIVFSFLWLNGSMQDDSQSVLTGLVFAIPGAFLGFLIKMKTKPSDPPVWLLTLNAILCFVMSIMWIQFTS